MLKTFLCSMCCLSVLTCVVLKYPEPVMGPLRSSWFLGHVHAAEGKGSDSLEFIFGKKSSMELHNRRGNIQVERLLQPDAVWPSV